MNWTIERIDLLRKLWSEGLSATQIAGQLGGVTRNAVIGKVHRLKLSSRGRTSESAYRKKKKTAKAAKVTTPKVTSKSLVSPAAETEVPQVAEVKVAQLPALTLVSEMQPTPRFIAESVVVPISRKLTLHGLTESTCKWPNGDPLTEDFSFCGVDTAETGPYCSYHSRIAFQPPAVRRRSR